MGSETNRSTELFLSECLGRGHCNRHYLASGQQRQERLHHHLPEQEDHHHQDDCGAVQGEHVSKEGCYSSYKTLSQWETGYASKMSVTINGDTVDMRPQRRNDFTVMGIVIVIVIISYLVCFNFDLIIVRIFSNFAPPHQLCSPRHQGGWSLERLSIRGYCGHQDIWMLC